MTNEDPSNQSHAALGPIRLSAISLHRDAVAGRRRAGQVISQPKSRRPAAIGREGSDGGLGHRDMRSHLSADPHLSGNVGNDF